MLNFLPKIRVFFVKGIKTEYTVVFTLNRRKIVFHQRQKVFIGVEDLALRGKFDHRHGVVQRSNNRFFMRQLFVPISDVIGDFDDFLHGAVFVFHGEIVGA